MKDNKEVLDALALEEPFGLIPGSIPNKESIWMYEGSDVRVKDILADGKVCRISGIDNNKERYVLTRELRSCVICNRILFQESNIHFDDSKTILNDVISKMFYFGLDLNPEYQRDLVWTWEQKQAFVKSLFQESFHPGVFFLHLNNDKSKYRYEVIDGKQRINAIISFVLNLIPLNFGEEDIYYKDLRPYDIRKFKNRMIYYNTAKNLTLEQKIKLFLDLNSTGVKMDDTHINLLKARYETLIKIEEDLIQNEEA